MAIKRTSLLRQLTDAPLAVPCSEPWTSMHGDDRVRRCNACERDVYDLSAMTELEAEARLLNAVDATPCIRYARDLDGRVLHRAAPPRLTPPSPRGMARSAALGVTLAVSVAHATDKQPAQCVAYAQPVAAPPPMAAAPASPPRNASAPPAAPAPIAVPQQPLGGAPPPAHMQPEFGTVSFRSKVARELVLIGITLHAPLASYRLTPGSFIADVKRPDGSTREVPFTVSANQTTVVDLDAPASKPR